MFRPYYDRQRTLELLKELVRDVDDGNPSVARKSQKHHAAWNAIRLLEAEGETMRNKSKTLRTPCCDKPVRIPLYGVDAVHKRTCRKCGKSHRVHVHVKARISSTRPINELDIRFL